MGKIYASIIAGLVLTVGTLAGYGIYDHCKYVREHRFTDTAIVKKDSLKLSAWHGNKYKILTRDNKILNHTSQDGEALQELEMIVEQGTKIRYTGYPDRTHPHRTIAEKIEPLTPLK